MKSAVEKFNTIAGKLDADVLLHDKSVMWKEIVNSSKRILEEAQETLDAAESLDILEVLDGLVDVFYTVNHLQSLLEMMNIDVTSAKEEVCENNLMKFSGVFYTFEENALQYKKQGEDVSVVKRECTDGDVYVMLRDSDNKVMKPIGHPSPDIKQYIPEGVFEYLGKKE